MIIGQFLSFGLGGADKSSYYLTKGLVESGVDVKVFYNNKSFPRRSPQMDIGVMLSRYDQCKALGVPMIEIENLSLLNDHGIDILNTHRSGDDLKFLPGFEATNFNFKVVETNFHGSTATKADMRVFPSHEMIIGRTIKGQHRVIPNPTMPKLTEDNLREELNLKDKFIFGRIGRPAADIYSPTSLQAFKRIENDSVHFLYVAPHQGARDDVNRFGIKNITFIEQNIDELYLSKIYNTFDVLCHANRMGETFGNTLAEAMMHGKPIVSHWGGKWPQAQKEVIGEDKIMYICDNKVDLYSNLMTKLFENKQEYNDYSTYANKRAEELYDYKTVTGRYVALYKEILEES